MPRDLPNLDWLRVFAATASAESFVAAAAKLGVTAGAVSQRIKSLEQSIGVALFQRHAQGVRLTEAGRRYAEKIAAPLGLLAAATNDVTTLDSAAPVRITVLPALAQIWLGPRLEDFHRRHENTHVEIWADAEIVDLPASNFDLAIRYGRPPFPGCDYRPMLHDELVPVASPALLRTAEIDAAGMPVNVPLNLDTYWASDFEDWLSDCDGIRSVGIRRQTFSLYSMVLDATLNGRGFMVGHTALISDLVQQGRLVRLSDRVTPAANQFHLLTKQGFAMSKAASAFAEWLASQ